MSAQEWQLDLKDAQKLALETDRKIVLVFSGSDWCAPCIKLDKEIWQSADFQTYAKENYVMLRADFPRKKTNQLSEAQAIKNGELAEKYNPNGYFPLVVVLDKKAGVLGKTGYKKMSPKEYISHLNSFNP
ncbi:thioredoxin family protein [Cyclobacterium plantarum]|uniref:thioredoxin family protein n=1 Tax=Cyclobacterium plantarum TaxID=2716263 RepID=UPI00293BB4CB|nr:thioredoxin family protein [Cyclobacterium plantarum]